VAEIHYDKLVRDKIPEIIARSGGVAVCVRVPPKEALDYLERKLGEELTEYRESRELEELADIQEVILAILRFRGVSREAFEAMRLKKREERGGFDGGILLQKVIERP